jgi:hypothetical protein
MSAIARLGRWQPLSSEMTAQPWAVTGLSEPESVRMGHRARDVATNGQRALLGATRRGPSLMSRPHFHAAAERPKGFRWYLFPGRAPLFVAPQRRRYRSDTAVD